MHLSRVLFSISILTTVYGDFRIKGKVKKRNTLVNYESSILPQCVHNGSVFHDEGALHAAVAKSDYIFTGKIASMGRPRRAGAARAKRPVIKVLIRRVLKGDFVELGDVISYETRAGRSSRAYVVVELTAARAPCATGARGGWSALFFSEGVSDLPLKLIVDPIPFSLERVRKIRSVIKGGHAARPGDNGIEEGYKTPTSGARAADVARPQRARYILSESRSRSLVQKFKLRLRLDTAVMTFVYARNTKGGLQKSKKKKSVDPAEARIKISYKADIAHPVGRTSQIAASRDTFGARRGAAGPADAWARGAWPAAPSKPEFEFPN